MSSAVSVMKNVGGPSLSANMQLKPLCGKEEKQELKKLLDEHLAIQE